MFYIYDQDTKQLNGITQGQPHPLREGEFLKPAHSTEVVPPEDYSVNEVPVYDIDNSVWALEVSDYKKALDAAQLEEVNSNGVALYEDVDGNVVARDAQVVADETAAVVAEQNARLLAENVLALKKTMDDNIVAKGMEVTKGTSLESVQAFVSAYQVRATNASAYADKGLKAMYPTEGFVVGASLDTAADIQTHYSDLLVLLDLHREAEIAAYLTAKALL